MINDNMMNLSRGAIHFHRLFTLRQLGLSNCEPFVDRIVRKFLEIGEAVAARWIEMPHAVLFFQMVPGQADSGAIYLYDRQQQLFYMIGFDAQEDNLTLEDFKQILAEYRLIRFVEQPSLISSYLPLAPKASPARRRMPQQVDLQAELASVILRTRILHLISVGARQPCPIALQPPYIPISTPAWLQHLGSA